MGQDKALLPLHGRSLLVRALETLGTLGGSLPRIAAPRPDLSAYAPVLPDLHPGCGPLSGIEAALSASAHPLNLFLPVDLPLIPAAFLQWLLLRAQVTGARMTVPRINGRPQPLCAIYHRDLLPSVTAALQAGDRKVMPVMTVAAGGSTDFFDVERIASTQSAFHTFSQQLPHRWFHNCNTPGDLNAIEMLYS